MSQEHAQPTVGPYELIRQIDSGGAALVYLAQQRNVDRLVALKVLDGLEGDDAARFVGVARVAGTLSHPHIVTTYDVFVHEGRAYVAMEFAPYGSLRPQVRRLSLPQAASVLEGVLAALGYAHAHGVVHGDIKPENVLIGEKGVVKLTDFGIATALRGAAPSSLFESPAHVAPEQALSGAPSTRADLYAVGVLAYELFTHRSPNGREAVPSLDRRLGAWVERMMALAPSERPAGADEAWRELERVLADIEHPLWRGAATLRVESERPAARGWIEPERVTAPVRDEPQTAVVQARPAPVRDEPRTAVVQARPAPVRDEPQTAVVEAPPEPVKPRLRGRRRAIGGAVAVLAAGLAAGGAYAALGSSPEALLDVRPIEKKVRTLVSVQTPVDAVRCPRDVPDRPGIRFACDVPLAQTDQRLLAIVTHRPDGFNDVHLRLR